MYYYLSKQGFGGNTSSKNVRKKILYKFLKGMLTAEIANIKKKVFLVFPIYKGAKYKNGCYYQRNI